MRLDARYLAESLKYYCFFEYQNYSYQQVFFKIDTKSDQTIYLLLVDFDWFPTRTTSFEFIPNQDLG